MVLNLVLKFMVGNFIGKFVNTTQKTTYAGQQSTKTQTKVGNCLSYKQRFHRETHRDVCIYFNVNSNFSYRCWLSKTAKLLMYIVVLFTL